MILRTGSSRRSFLKGTTGAVVALQTGASLANPSASAQSLASVQAKSLSGSIQVQGQRLLVDTPTLSATIEKGFLVSLKSKATGEEFLRPFDLNKSSALQLVYKGDETVELDESRFGTITCRSISRNRAEVVFHSWNGDGVLAVSVDADSGDLLLEPSAFSSRPGVLACRYWLDGLRPDLELVAPLFQGVRLKLDDPLLTGKRWPWPISWEAGLAIFQSRNGGFWIHTQDTHYRYKGLKTGSKANTNALGVDSEAYGPIEANLSAGGLAWRVNVFQEDWKVPAARYREWLWNAYRLKEQEARRKPWIYDVKLALSWCPGNPEILDALAHKVSPNRILLHFPDWRTDAYDENYPAYTASQSGRDFIAKAHAMGFHIMPHCNSVDMDPSHPVYDQVRDFQYRDIERQQIRGWGWQAGKVIGVPESNRTRLMHRDKKIMVKVHPGLSLWRSILGDNIQKAAQSLNLQSVFIDVTLTTWNLYNSLVEATTSTEGMKRLIDHVGSLGEGLVVGGEGLNEITFQGLSFAQAHLFESWHESAPGLERAGGCALNELLFGKLCRTIGYSGLGGKNPDEELRMRIHRDHGAIPTLTIKSAQEITSPVPAVKQILDQAAAG